MAERTLHVVTNVGHYEKAKPPFVSSTVVEGNLVTGQNPGSAKATAEKVAERL